MIRIKRAYDPASKGDGFRVLVDRLWPRGIKKENLTLNEWMKSLAPSSALRKKFGHDPERWKQFESGYKKELKSPSAREKIGILLGIAKKKNITLLYGARDRVHNNAVVLKHLLEQML
jgi:uncharacterized protein YeaO (DUF488 family)